MQLFLRSTSLDCIRICSIRIVVTAESITSWEHGSTWVHLSYTYGIKSFPKAPRSWLKSLSYFITGVPSFIGCYAQLSFNCPLIQMVWNSFCIFLGMNWFSKVEWVKGAPLRKNRSLDTVRNNPILVTIDESYPSQTGKRNVHYISSGCRNKFLITRHESPIRGSLSQKW